jgi:pyruvate dehydrogenase E1 component alpha subunit
MYRIMETIRQFELKAVDLFQAGELPGFLHSSLGQEATPAGTCINLHKDDYILTTHRGHGHVIAKGTDINRMMAELYAKIDGCCKGKGGSMHIMDRSLNILGANGIVGAGIPIATGAGLSIDLKKTKQVAVCFFGDGSTNEGAFHEGLNLASLWNLPVVFVCENNQYAESTSKACHCKNCDIAIRAVAYDMAYAIGNGNDVLDVYQKTKDAIDRARTGQGPTLIEFKTYRWLGHYVGDPGVYRPKEEVKEWKEKREPIAKFRTVLEGNKIATARQLDQIKDEVGKEIEAAVTFGRNSPEPDLALALQHVYANNWC